ncbi:hypothetical protein D3C80_1585540 [compost metagenome]
MPMARAAFRVIQLMACSSEMFIPARRPADRAAAASWLRRWISSASSEWMTAQEPSGASVRAAFSSMPSRASILKPHQPVHMAAQTPSRASSGAIL